MDYVTSLVSFALIASAIRVTMPILLASLGAVYTERGGVVNIGLEGIMIMGTFFGAVGGYLFDAQFPQLAGAWPDLAPFAGLFDATAAGLLLVIASQWVLTRTRFGLRLRAVGEYPLAADTLGINVYRLRYAGVLLSGALAGMAGAYLAIEQAHLYFEGMTQGRGFIALAAMIFGNWWPVGALGASALFGYFDALSLRVARLPVPYQFISVLPHIVTILVLAGFVRRARMPAADGVPYTKEEE